MTEDEAKTKWCPFARNVAGVVSDDGTRQHVAQQGAYNRIVDSTSGNWAFPKSGGCIGSACMAWRWIGVRRRTDAPDGRTIDHFDERSAKEARAKTYHNRNVGFLGHCGLAGRP